MSFWEDLGKIALAPVTGGATLLGGLGGDKGLLGGTGEFLFGDTGQTDFGVTPYEVGRTPKFASGSYANPSTTQGGLQDMVKTAYSENRNQRTPQARFSPQVGVNPYSGATINTGDFNQAMQSYNRGNALLGGSRGSQLNALSLLRSAAEGRAPSAAESQLQSGLDQALKSQLAAANSARGGSGAQQAAQRNAAFNAVDLKSNAIRDAATLRAEEMANARNAYLGGTEALRSGDINTQGLGLNAAQLALSPALAQAQLAQQAGLQTQGLQTQAGLQNQELINATNLANLGAELQARGLQGDLSLGLLGQLGGIDARTMQGRQALEDAITKRELGYEQLGMSADQFANNLNAQIALANAGIQPQLLGSALQFGGSLATGLA